MKEKMKRDGQVSLVPSPTHQGVSDRDFAGTSELTAKPTIVALRLWKISLLGTYINKRNSISNIKLQDYGEGYHIYYLPSHRIFFSRQLNFVSQLTLCQIATSNWLCQDLNFLAWSRERQGYIFMRTPSVSCLSCTDIDYSDNSIKIF